MRRILEGPEACHEVQTAVLGPRSGPSPAGPGAPAPMSTATPPSRGVMLTLSQARSEVTGESISLFLPSEIYVGQIFAAQSTPMMEGNPLQTFFVDDVPIVSAQFGSDRFGPEFAGVHPGEGRPLFEIDVVDVRESGVTLWLRAVEPGSAALRVTASGEAGELSASIDVTVFPAGPEGSPARRFTGAPGPPGPESAPPEPIAAPTATPSGPTPTPASAPPAAPSALRAHLDVDFPGIVLTWDDNSDNENIFRLDRSEGLEDAWRGHMVTTTDEIRMLDSFVVEGTRYCYRVLARNAAGMSAATNVACIVFDLP